MRTLPSHGELALAWDVNYYEPGMFGGSPRSDVRFTHVQPDLVVAAGLCCKTVGQAPNAAAAAGLVQFNSQRGVRAQLGVISLIDPDASRASAGFKHMPVL